MVQQLDLIRTDRRIRKAQIVAGLIGFFPAKAGSAAATIERLRTRLPADRWSSWYWTVGFSVLVFFFRLIGIGYPTKLIFDETYYAKDAWALIHTGHEKNWPDNVDSLFAQGHTPGWSATGSYVVHPPVGKWLIGFGEWLFGMNSFGWRCMSCVAGAVMIAVVIRLTRRLSGSTTVGMMAGILLSLDGLAFVMSRIALLDIFQAMFLVLALAALLADRDWMRNKLADHLQSHDLVDLAGSFGPTLRWRPWRCWAGLWFGLATAVKWNSGFALAALAFLSLYWDLSARRLAGAKNQAWRSILTDGFTAIVQQGVLAVLVYVSTWAGWFSTSRGYYRNWGLQHPADPTVRMLGPDLASWLHYQTEIAAFHTGEYIKKSTHTYDAKPWGWIVMFRTTGVDAVNGIAPGTQGCPPNGDQCLRVISAMGTPLLWWCGLIGLLIASWWWLTGRDWRVEGPLTAIAAIWLPFFFNAERPLFFFYAVCIIPFTCICLALVLGKLLGAAQEGSRRQWGATVVGIIVFLIAVNFAFIYPILTDAALPRWQWALRMWLMSWV